MAFSFLKMFGKKPEDQKTPAPQAPPAPSGPAQPKVPAPGESHDAHKSATKVVKPKSVKTFNLREQSRKMAQGGKMDVPAKALPPTISMSGVQLKPEGVEAVGGDTGDQPSSERQAPDTDVTLSLADLAARVPNGFLREDAPDSDVQFQVPAREIYSGLIKGKATLPLSRIAELCPDSFAKPVTAEEDAAVQLPLHKLVEQLGDFLKLSDQDSPDSVPEIETPFSKVAREDGSKQLSQPGDSPTSPATTPEPPSAPSAPEAPAEKTSTSQLPKPPKLPRLGSSGAPAPIMPPNPNRPSTVRANVAGAKLSPAVPKPKPKEPLLPQSSKRSSEDTFIGQTQTIRPLLKPAAPVKPERKSSEGESEKASPEKQKKLTARIKIPPLSLRKPAQAEGEKEPTPPDLPKKATSTEDHPEATGAPPKLSFPPEDSPTEAQEPPKEEASEAVAEPTSTPASLPKPPVPLKLKTESPPDSKAEPAADEPPGDTTAEDQKQATLETPSPSPGPSDVAPPEEGKIRLNLAAIFRAFPDHLVEGDLQALGQDDFVDLPLEIIQPQMARGKVSVPLQVFQEALPERFQRIFSNNDPEDEVPLPLQEIFQNLPEGVLTLPHEQEHEEIGEEFQTPFSDVAKEDAERLKREQAEANAAPEAPPMETASTSGQPAESPDGQPGLPEEASPAEPADEAGEPSGESPAEQDQAVLSPSPGEQDSKDEATQTPVVKVPEQETSPNQAQASEAPLPGEEVKPTEEAPSAEAVSKEIADREDTPIGGPAAEPGPIDEEEATTEASSLATDEEPAPEPAIVDPSPPTTEKAPAAPSEQEDWDPSRLQALFMTDEELESRSITRLATELPGIAACMVMFSDGLRIAGELPETFNSEAFCAIAPHFYQRVEKYAGDLALSRPRTVTIYTDDHHVSLFLHEPVCVAVLHQNRGFMPGVREKFLVIVEELAKLYSNQKSQTSND